MKDTALRDAAAEFEKATKQRANGPADQVATLAVRIATEGQEQATPGR